MTSSILGKKNEKNFLNEKNERQIERIKKIFTLNDMSTDRQVLVFIIKNVESFGHFCIEITGN